MSVITRNKFGRHVKRTFLIIHVTTGWTETTFASKGNGFGFPTVRAAVNSAAVGSIATMNHFINVVNDSFARM